MQEPTRVFLSRGAVWVDPTVLSKVPLLNLSCRGRRKKVELTARERDVTRLILKHRGNVHKVAAELYSSPSCVRYHLSNPTWSGCSEPVPG